MQEYKMLKPFIIPNRGHLAPGDKVMLHDSQARFLVAGGILEPVSTNKGSKNGGKNE